MRRFCTLFDANYLTRGIALYESLLNHCGPFHIYAVAFDDLALRTLQRLKLEHLTAISLPEFEDDALLAVKGTRDAREYFWTCTPSIILYCLERFGLEECTYLDADLYFWSDPEPIFSEIGEQSVLLTEHRFSPAYSAFRSNGIYNVQFMYFRNDSNGVAALGRWRGQCLEWCHAYAEDGKFGDQKYLDDWPSTLDGVHVLQNLSAALAPWNIQSYHLRPADGDIICTHTELGAEGPVIFYHFHGLRLSRAGYALLSGYELTRTSMDLLYRPYINRLVAIQKGLEADVGFPVGVGMQAELPGWELRRIEAKMKAHRSGNSPVEHYVLVFDADRYALARSDRSVGRLLVRLAQMAHARVRFWLGTARELFRRLANRWS